ncbi:MAG: PH domain-containing protein [Haloferacaceae archaeon]
MKLSPVTVPYRVVRRGASLAFTALFFLATGSSVVGGMVGTLAGVGLVGLGLLALGVYEVAYWRRYEYELTADTFDIRSGVISRREREIPLRRIQNVDISRSVVQRLLGIAAIDLETAGGGGTEAAVRYVSFAEAKRLQRAIADRKRGAEPAAEAPVHDGDLLFALSDRELALVGALSFDLRVPGLLFVLLSGSATAVPTVLGVRLGGTLAFVVLGAAVLLVVLLVSWGAGAVVAVLNYYGFRLTRVGDELQYERGLLRRYDGSIPLDKVQTLTVADNPLKRRFGYASLYIETAGHVPGPTDRGSQGSQVAVPLARAERARDLAREIEPFGDPAIERPPGRVRRRYVARYLLGLGGLVGLLYGVETVVDAGFPWYAPLALLPVLVGAAHLKWCHRGYWLGDDHLVTRNGVLKRETKVVPYYRVQTVIDSRTLFQRRWRLGTVTADTAGSLSLTGSDAAAVDVDQGVADRLRRTLVDRLRTALAERGRTRGWQWGDVEPASNGSATSPGTDREPTAAADEASDDRGGGPVDEGPGPAE